MSRIAGARPVQFLKSLYTRIFTQSPSPRRVLASQIVVHHFARFAWLYLIAFLVLTVYCFHSLLSELAALLAIIAGLVLLFVAPPFRIRILRAVEQFLQTFTVISLITVNVVGTILSFLDIFDRTSDNRLAAIPGNTFLGMGSDFPTPLALTLGLTTVAATLAIFLIRRLYVSSIRLAFIALVVACMSLTVCVPAAVVLSRHNSGGFLADLGPSFAESIVAGFTLQWSLAAIAILARHATEVPLSVGPPAESPSNEYVKAASAIATTALVIAFFGLNTCWSYTASLDRFIGIREAFAADLVAVAIPLSPELQRNLVNRKRTHQISGSGMYSVDEDAQVDYEALKATLPPVDSITGRPLWLEKAEIQSVIDHNGGFLSSYRRGIMFGITVKEADRPHSWSAFPTLSFPDDLMPNHTLKAAAECAGQLEDATTYDKIYRACEKTVLDRGVKFPLIDVEFPIQYIILVTFIAICGCIIILSDRVQTILDLPPSAKIEPWIVLDATTRAGKLLANAWAIGLCITPWMLISIAVAITALRIRVDGSISDLGSDALVAASLLAGTIVSGWLSVSLLKRLALLRLLRRMSRHVLAQAAPLSSQEPPAEAPVIDSIGAQ